MKTLQLFFGRNIGSTDYVSSIQWETFSHSIDKAFEGYTVQDALGSWKGNKEKTKVVSILCKSKEDEEKVKTLCSLYCKTFNQDAVAVQELPALTFIS